MRFLNGAPDSDNFRKFKIKSIVTQNDYAALQEIVTRRYKNPKELPDIVLIDGGKGQLSAVSVVLKNIENKFGNKTVCVSLAKRKEILYSDNHLEGVQLDVKTDSGRLCRALRDYAHHFAISYHKVIRKKERV